MRQKNSRLKNKLTQFGYEHGGLEASLDVFESEVYEVNRMLENMAQREEKGKGKENVKKIKK